MSRKRVVDVSTIFDDGYRKALDCQGKKKYDSEYQAKFAADNQFERGNTKVKLHWYLCKYCGKWHLSHEN